MRDILILTGGLFGLFTFLFALNLGFGWITPENLEAWLRTIRDSRDAGLWLAGAVILVLSIDSVLTVPTLTTVALSGFFLGPIYGGLVASVGLMAAGSICFFGSRYGGTNLFRKMIAGDEAARLADWFHRSGGLALILSRALPMFPEVLSVLAGVSGIRASLYYLYFALGSVPYAFLVAWAGSESTLRNPWPVLAIGVGVPAVAWLVYYTMGRRRAGSI
ncbi:MAG: VTT domain-containing protein [Leptospirales bacterium]|jgi:uncharacterized membrane protein YdjX (TVP38/TMEM64 family)